jgi:hypothetical protein
MHGNSFNKRNKELQNGLRWHRLGGKEVSRVSNRYNLARPKRTRPQPLLDHMVCLTSPLVFSEPMEEGGTTLHV